MLSFFVFLFTKFKRRRQKVEKFSLFFVSLLFFSFLVLPALAMPISVGLAGVGNAQPRGGAYAGLYELTVAGAPVLAMCDDRLTAVNIGDTWSANWFSYADIQAGAPVKFASLGVEKYSQAGYLVSLLRTVSYSNQADINLAVWDIMSPGSVVLNSVAVGYYNTATSGLYDNFDFSTFARVLTAIPLDASQEYFIQTVPEPTSLVLLITGFVWLLILSPLRKKS
jgi:hypothetical protein